MVEFNFNFNFDNFNFNFNLKAIAEARVTGHDCVLVDTAGRMQNNGKLMQELAKLVQVVVIRMGD